MNTIMHFRFVRYWSVIAIATAFCAALLATPAAAAPSPVGTWAVAGTLKVSAKFPKVITSTTSLNAKVLGMTLTYGENGSFSSTLLGLGGTWTQSGNKINIDLTDWINGIKSTVASLLPANTAINVTKASFTARAVNAKRLTGKVNLVIDATIPGGSSLGGVPLTQEVKGRITISGALQNTPVAAAAPVFGLDLGSEAKPVQVLNRLIGALSLYQLIPH